MEKDQHSCCLCCFLPTIHFLLYVTSTVLQWILFAIVRADRVECTENPLLAAAVLSTIATLFTSVDTTCGYCDCQRIGELHTYHYQITVVCVQDSCRRSEFGISC